MAQDLTGAIDQWVVVGQPDERWLRKASGRAGKVFVFTYGDRLVDVWWEQNRDKLEKLPNLVVYRLTADDAQALGGLASRIDGAAMHDPGRRGADRKCDFLDPLRSCRMVRRSSSSVAA